MQSRNDDSFLLIVAKQHLENDYTILTDTTCTGRFVVPVKMRHVSQALMDSISVDFYNLIIIKGKDKKAKMVTTEESGKMLRFIE